MEHSRISYVLLTRLCPCALSVEDTIWKKCNFKRPCKAGLDVDDRRVEKRLCGNGNAKERRKIPSGDACKGVLAQILEGDCLEMQKLALFLLFLPCRFLLF